MDRLCELSSFSMMYETDRGSKTLQVALSGIRMQVCEWRVKCRHAALRHRAFNLRDA
jgi:hypothetical protein